MTHLEPQLTTDDLEEDFDDEMDDDVDALMQELYGAAEEAQDWCQSQVSETMQPDEPDSLSQQPAAIAKDLYQHQREAGAPSDDFLGYLQAAKNSKKQPAALKSSGAPKGAQWMEESIEVMKVADPIVEVLTSHHTKSTKLGGPAKPWHETSPLKALRIMGLGVMLASGITLLAMMPSNSDAVEAAAAVAAAKAAIHVPLVPMQETATVKMDGSQTVLGSQEKVTEGKRESQELTKANAQGETTKTEEEVMKLATIMAKEEVSKEEAKAEEEEMKLATMMYAQREKKKKMEEEAEKQAQQFHSATSSTLLQMEERALQLHEQTEREKETVMAGLLDAEQAKQEHKAETDAVAELIKQQVLESVKEEKAEKGLKDVHPECSTWATLGECQKNPDWMLAHCSQSCALKMSQMQHQNCDQWAAQGECEKNPAWMGSWCKTSCQSTSQGSVDASPLVHTTEMLLDSLASKRTRSGSSVVREQPDGKHGHFKSVQDSLLEQLISMGGKGQLHANPR